MVDTIAAETILFGCGRLQGWL